MLEKSMVDPEGAESGEERPHRLAMEVGSKGPLGRNGEREREKARPDSAVRTLCTLSCHLLQMRRQQQLQLRQASLGSVQCGSLFWWWTAIHCLGTTYMRRCSQTLPTNASVTSCSPSSCSRRGEGCLLGSRKPSLHEISFVTMWSARCHGCSQ